MLQHSSIYGYPQRLFCHLCWGTREEAVCSPCIILSEPRFQELLRQLEQEFGYNHPMGGITIPCSEAVVTHLASRFV
ncbi:putative small auxin-up RNA [Helianthus annuus]|nr:putative small auxin-up RNA [Helianthus annuus]KAJ0813500.1 putative small auxin-up RNA [Helianthus annuus]